MDRYNGFFCQCPPAWKVCAGGGICGWRGCGVNNKLPGNCPILDRILQGAFCDVDVNECSEYAGTDLGCQNGATCVNTPGSFT